MGTIEVMVNNRMPSRLTGSFRLIGDFIVLIFIGLLWIPLQLSQQRPASTEPAEIQECSEKGSGGKKSKPAS